MEEHNVSVEGSNNNLTQYIDFLRTKDKTIGFYGDEGVTALGGKITDQYFTSTNSQSIKKISDVVKKHFAQNKDNYYVLYDNPSNNFVIMTTGYGTSNLKSLPIGSKIASFDDSSISSAGIGLYGTLGQKGRIRLAIYFKFNTTVITQSSIKNDF